MSAVVIEARGFEGIWASGLGISAARGLADNGVMTMTERHAAAAAMREASCLPIIADVDSGFGDESVLARMTRLYEAAGIDGICIEDKEFPKRNSFLPGNVLASIDSATRRIDTIKQAQVDSSFFVIARLESLIVGAGLDDAVRRACSYRDAGADALLIHSKASTAHEIRDFCLEAQLAGIRLPILAIPTTYHSVTAVELARLGVSGVVYANQLLRASIAAMEHVLRALDEHDSTSPVEPGIVPMDELFALIDRDSRIATVPTHGSSPVAPV